jgi:hypothetical protein
MTTFTRPYPFTFDPATATSGAPVVVNRGVPSIGTRDFVLESNRSGASSAELISSFGADAGVAHDRWDAPGVPASQLSVVATFDFDSVIFTSGVFASARAVDWTNIYIEEFQSAGGAFIRAWQSPDRVITSIDETFFSARDDRSDGGQSFVQAFEIPITQGHFYRAWFDVHGSMRAAGWGGIGGSGSRVQLSVSLRLLDVFFTGRI